MKPVTIVPRATRGWAVCIATGPSLTPGDIDLCAGLPRFGVNNAYELSADLDHLYACDPEWWQRHYGRAQLLRAELWSQIQEGCTAPWPYDRVQRVRGDHRPSLSTRADRIHYGSNSGYQVINLAYLMGYTNLILLGYDMGPGKNGELHFFGNHPPGLARASNYQAFMTEYATINCGKLGVRIINATRRTYLPHFERMTLENALELATHSAAVPQRDGGDPGHGSRTDSGAA